MERTPLPYALSRSKSGIDVIFTISNDGQHTIIDNIRIEGVAARKLKLPENPSLGQNSAGEAAFYRYNAAIGETVFYENTPTIRKIISAIMKKLEESAIQLT